MNYRAHCKFCLIRQQSRAKFLKQKLSISDVRHAFTLTKTTNIMSTQFKYHIGNWHIVYTHEDSPHQDLLRLKIYLFFFNLGTVIQITRWCNHSLVDTICSRTSMARTPLRPWTLVRDRGSSSVDYSASSAGMIRLIFRFSLIWRHIVCSH